MKHVPITHAQKRALEQITKNHAINFMVLYGSLARGTIVSVSPDIDIGIYRNGGFPAEEVLSIVDNVQHVFSGKSVDVKMLNGTDPLFRFEVMRDGVFLCGDKRRYQEFYLYCYRDYRESQPLYRALKTIQQRRQSLLSAYA